MKLQFCSSTGPTALSRTQMLKIVIVLRYLSFYHINGSSCCMPFFLQLIVSNASAFFVHANIFMVHSYQLQATNVCFSRENMKPPAQPLAN